jgi:hypothetical protein
MQTSGFYYHSVFYNPEGFPQVFLGIFTASGNKIIQQGHLLCNKALKVETQQSTLWLPCFFNNSLTKQLFFHHQHVHNDRKR